MQELGEGKNELEAVKNKMHQDEEGKVNNPEISLVSPGFETENGKKISISEEGQKSVQNILREFQGNLQETDYETELKDIKARISMESKFRKTANSSAQIKTGFHAANTKRGFQDCLQEKQDKSTGFQTANGKHVVISEKGKKLVEGLLKEFHQSHSDGDIESNLLCLKNKITCKKASMLSQQKTSKTSSTSRKEDGASGSSKRDVSLLSLNRKHYLKIIKDRMASKCEKTASSSKEEDGVSASSCKSRRKIDVAGVSNRIDKQIQQTDGLIESLATSAKMVSRKSSNNL
uniref:Uncharacterized protein n=1 Tax=Glossina morsitans morsitans TaxID=37546 RepID=A0A1B0FG48_GLOMM